MAKRQKPPADELTTRILQCNHAHLPHEYFQCLVTRQLERFGLEGPNACPQAITSDVDSLCDLYTRAVCDDPWSDILGRVYMAIASNGARGILGQFFTPEPIAKLLAWSSLGGQDSAPPKPQKLIKVLEPACGSGVLLLAFAQCVIERDGTDALAAYSFTAVDLDLTVARTAAAELLSCLRVTGAALGELVVLHGNSLDASEEMQVIVHATHCDLAERFLPALHPQRLEAVRSAAAEGLQPDFFGDAPAVASTPAKGPRRAGMPATQTAAHARGSMPLFSAMDGAGEIVRAPDDHQGSP